MAFFSLDNRTPRTFPGHSEASDDCEGGGVPSCEQCPCPSRTGLQAS